jgi:hypothetical protein
MMADSFMGSHRARFIEQAARHKVLAVYPFRSASAEGGLLSYGPDFSDFYLHKGSTWIAFLGARSRMNCQFRYRPSSNWWST